MGAAGEVGMDEGRTGKVRRVSVNSAGSFIPFSCIFYGLDHCLLVFILFDCFFRNLGFFYATIVFECFLILLRLQHYNRTPYRSLVSCNFAMKIIRQRAMLAVSAFTMISSMDPCVHPSTTSPLATECQLELLFHFSRVCVYYPGAMSIPPSALSPATLFATFLSFLLIL
jgi:hypothetical protein